MIRLADIQKQNAWKERGKSILPDGYIDRKLCESIIPFLDRDEIVIILGPRQSGKTTLLNWFIQKYQELGLAKENIFYLNLDNKLMAAQLGEPLDFAEYFRSLKKHEGRVILMLDEVQRVSDAGLFLKNIHDAFKDDIKIFCSGSSSLEIKAKTKEHLTGRKKDFSLFPLSLKEIARRNLAYLRDIDKIDFKTLKRIQRLYAKDLEDIFNLYSRYGGYPKVFLAPNVDLKNSLLEEIYETYVKKDVVDFLKIENIPAFNKIVYLIASQVGGLVNKNEIAGTVGISAPTVDKYLHILESTFTVFSVPPYYTNKRKEITSMNKIFFYDTGLYNFINRTLLDNNNYLLTGGLLENVIGLELKKNLPQGTYLHFWRTQKGAEVDFILQTGAELVPIEVKVSSLKKPKITRGLSNFIKAFKPKRAVFVNQNYLNVTRIADTEVIFVPYSLFALFPLETIKCKLIPHRQTGNWTTLRK